MNSSEQRLSINIEQIADQPYLSIIAKAKLTHQDYKTFSPMLDSALSSMSKTSVNTLINCIDFEGWELRAAWDDFKLGLKYDQRFNKIAIVANKSGQDQVAKIANWFIGGEIKFFETDNDALKWIAAA